MRGIEGLRSANVMDSGRSSRLTEAAHEFEAQMMKELLKPLTSEMGVDDENDPGLGPRNVLVDFASESLGRALSRQGGLGIANEILKSASQDGNGVAIGDMTGKLHQNELLSHSEGLE